MGLTFEGKAHSVNREQYCRIFSVEWIVSVADQTLCIQFKKDLIHLMWGWWLARYVKNYMPSWKIFFQSQHYLWQKSYLCNIELILQSFKCIIHWCGVEIHNFVCTTQKVFVKVHHHFSQFALKLWKPMKCINFENYIIQKVYLFFI